VFSLYRRAITIYREQSDVKMPGMILVDPLPRTLAMICDDATRARMAPTLASEVAGVGDGEAVADVAGERRPVVAGTELTR